jgi:hypothetical protein
MPLAAGIAGEFRRPTHAVIGLSMAAQGGTGLAGDGPRLLDLPAGPFEFPAAPRRGEKLEVEEGTEAQRGPLLSTSSPFDSLAESMRLG